jgi:putative NADH-flavin reductase
MKITVLGGSGYTGGNIVREAVGRGHEVTSFSRTVPADQVAGVRYEIGSLLDDAVRQRAVAGADVVIGALAPRSELETGLEALYARLEELAAAAGARLGIVGGFSTLRPAEGAPRMVEGDGVPAEFAAEARVMHTVLMHFLDAAPAHLDWFYASPAASYGSHAPGEATGGYRIGGEVALLDENGESALSGADFALAVVDEIETPAHHRSQFSVAY